MAASTADLRYVGGDNDSTGGHVVVEGNRLYVGSYGRGMRIFDVSNPAAPRQIGQYTPGPRADAVPDAITFGDRHFAVLNGTRRVTTTDFRTDKSEFLDATDPAAPILLHTFVGPDDGEAHNGDIVDLRRLWLPSGGTAANGLRLYDLTPTLTTPASECRPSAADNPCAPVNLFRGNPVELWENSPYRGDKPVGAAFTHTHDISVYTDYPVQGLGPRDIALLAEGGNYLGSGDTGSVFVVDVTDPRNPVVLNRWLHEKGPSHHPIRYHHEAQFLDGDQRVMLVTDEDLHSTPNCGRAGGVAAVRLSDDLMTATELSEWFIPTSPAPVCSVHVFSSVGSTAFFGSYNAGLQVVDYSDPSNPQRVAADIRPGSTAWGALYHQGHVYVGDMSRGLDVYGWEAPAAAAAPSTAAGPSTAAAARRSRCEKPAGRARGNSLGRAKLGRSRAANRRAMPSAQRRRTSIDQVCLQGGGALRIGYPSKALLRSLSKAERRRVAGEAVLILTSSRHFSIRGVRAGDGSRAMRRRIKGERAIRVGRNVWYLARGTRATLVFKVGGRRVSEVGIADRRLTTGRASARRFLGSFR